jgi:hypothetical protein
MSWVDFLYTCKSQPGEMRGAGSPPPSIFHRFLDGKVSKAMFLRRLSFLFIRIYCLFVGLR